MTLEVHPPHNHPNQLLEHSLAPAPAETLWASSLSGEPGLRRPPRRALANSAASVARGGHLLTSPVSSGCLAASQMWWACLILGRLVLLPQPGTAPRPPMSAWQSQTHPSSFSWDVSPPRPAPPWASPSRPGAQAELRRQQCGAAPGHAG